MRLNLALIITLAACAPEKPEVLGWRNGRTGDIEHRTEIRPKWQIVVTAKRVGSGPDATAFAESCMRDAVDIAIAEGRTITARPHVDAERLQQSVTRNSLTGAMECSLTIPLLVGSVE